MRRISYFGIGLALCIMLQALQADAQNQNQSNAQSQASSGSSLGDYARQVRKEGGGATAKAKTKVFDNDNLPREDKLSVIGEPAPAPADTAAESKPAANAAASGDAKPAGENKSTTETKPSTETKSEAQTGKAETKVKPEDDAAAKQAVWKQWQDRLAAQRDQIALLQRELDVLQREYQIRAAAFYADAGNRLRNSGDWDKTDAQYKQQIADKMKAAEDAKQKLETMDDEARRAGVPASLRE